MLVIILFRQPLSFENAEYIKYPKPDPNAIKRGDKNQLTRKSSTGLPSQDHTQQATSSSTGTKPTPVAAPQQSTGSDNELRRGISAQDVRNQHPGEIGMSLQSPSVNGKLRRTSRGDNDGDSSAESESIIHERTLSPDRAHARSLAVHTASPSGPVQRLVKMVKNLRQARNKRAHVDERESR